MSKKYAIYIFKNLKTILTLEAQFENIFNDISRYF
jgi:hypothetical protein